MPKITVDRVTKYSQSLIDGIISCAVYTTRVQSYAMNDITHAIFNIDSVEYDQDIRSSAVVYSEVIFAHKLETRENVLEMITQYRTAHPYYSEFKLDDALVENVWNILRKFAELLPNIFAGTIRFTWSTFHSIVNDIIY